MFFFYVPIRIVLFYLDQIKDWILVARITFSLGGPVIMIESLINYHSFSSMVCQHLFDV